MLTEQDTEPFKSLTQLDQAVTATVLLTPTVTVSDVVKAQIQKQRREVPESYSTEQTTSQSHPSETVITAPKDQEDSDIEEANTILVVGATDHGHQMVHVQQNHQRSQTLYLADKLIMLCKTFVVTVITRLHSGEMQTCAHIFN